MFPNLIILHFQALNVEKCSLLGWSDGGITSLIIAAKYPEIVNKLVVWGANASVGRKDFDAYESMILFSC